jgi:hypothetical protein
MSKLSAFAPAFLSVALPGLGQVAQKRYLPSVGFFLAFLMGMSFAALWWWVPIVALAAGIDALRMKAFERVWDRKLQVAYGVVGGLGLLSWLGLLSMRFTPVGVQMQINQDIERFEAVVKQCSVTSGSAREAVLACLNQSPEAPLRDPFGNPYVFSLQPERLELRSLGLDGKSGTEDDWIYFAPLR